MIQITKTGTLFSGSAQDIERLRAQFRQQHIIKLPGLLESTLLQIIRDRINQNGFYERTHEGIGSNRELCLLDHSTSVRLHFLLNGQKFFRLIQEITQCGRIGSFMGRVYRVIPGHGHHDSWHGDIDEYRMIAMSINLGTEAYAGGVLQIRDRVSKRILQQMANTGFGDAIIFRLAPDLQHRITETRGTLPKTAFAGWFMSQPDFFLPAVGFNQHAEVRGTAAAAALNV